MSQKVEPAEAMLFLGKRHPLSESWTWLYGGDFVISLSPHRDPRALYNRIYNKGGKFVQRVDGKKAPR